MVSAWVISKCVRAPGNPAVDAERHSQLTQASAMAMAACVLTAGRRRRLGAADTRQAVIPSYGPIKTSACLKLKFNASLVWF